ncbi:MAG: hypothetical protein ACP5SH_24850 [Syntrophobacteraceae bacterium]
MDQDVLINLAAIQQRVDSGEFLNPAQLASEWGGADVIITSRSSDRVRKWLADSPLVISPQETEPRRQAVITEFSKELSWLFCQLRDAFSGSIDFISKYDFYGRLAQTALEYLEENNGKTQCVQLLNAVLGEAWRMANEGKTRNS